MQSCSHKKMASNWCCQGSSCVERVQEQAMAAKTKKGTRVFHNRASPRMLLCAWLSFFSLLLHQPLPTSAFLHPFPSLPSRPCPPPLPPPPLCLSPFAPFPTLGAIPPVVLTEGETERSSDLLAELDELAGEGKYQEALALVGSGGHVVGPPHYHKVRGSGAKPFPSSTYMYGSECLAFPSAYGRRHGLES
ncbi:hypothetical protein Naga_101581g2 [Nannochloropsis gaditana]|uniref:Uncharacterized protein n=1 Tax=Nannochloropsis gaditana TaxID=72520 RepID=W7TGX6_9STRA|nr:hypothetical protein Naga_101581g2 [Nannochloropsis gaditana]